MTIRNDLTPSSSRDGTNAKPFPDDPRLNPVMTDFPGPHAAAPCGVRNAATDDQTSAQSAPINNAACMRVGAAQAATPDQATGRRIALVLGSGGAAGAGYLAGALLA